MGHIKRVDSNAQLLLQTQRVVKACGIKEEVSKTELQNHDGDIQKKQFSLHRYIKTDSLVQSASRRAMSKYGSHSQATNRLDAVRKLKLEVFQVLIHRVNATELVIEAVHPRLIVAQFILQSQQL